MLVAPDAEPPVCKVMDYGKHLFELKKSRAAQRKKQKQIQVKEVKFRLVIGSGDFDVKTKKINKFLDEGFKVKVSLRLRNREFRRDRIDEFFSKVADSISEFGMMEGSISTDVRQVSGMFIPKTK